jgi:hypothetical protein
VVDFDYENTLQVDAKELKMLWTGGYYDGPIDGFCVYKDKVHAFNMIDENTHDTIEDHKWYRKYELVELTKEEVLGAYIDHCWFRECVGGHWDSSELEIFGSESDTKTKETWDLYYDVMKTWTNPEYVTRKPIAWFEL